MNKRFNDYLSGLTPKKRDLVQEAIAEYLKGENEQIEKLDSAYRIAKYCHDLTLLDVEHFDILLMNNNYQIIKRVNISSGGYTETACDVRVIMRECLLNKATTLAIVHNHPSGALLPSREDDKITKTISDAAKIMRIYLVDHVIVATGGYYSYREASKL